MKTIAISSTTLWKLDWLFWSRIVQNKICFITVFFNIYKTFYRAEMNEKTVFEIKSINWQFSQSSRISWRNLRHFTISLKSQQLQNTWYSNKGHPVRTCLGHVLSKTGFRALLAGLWGPARKQHHFAPFKLLIKKILDIQICFSCGYGFIFKRGEGLSKKRKINPEKQTLPGDKGFRDTLIVQFWDFDPEQLGTGQWDFFLSSTACGARLRAFEWGT